MFEAHTRRVLRGHVSAKRPKRHATRGVSPRGTLCGKSARRVLRGEGPTGHAVGPDYPGSRQAKPGAMGSEGNTEPKIAISDPVGEVPIGESVTAGWLKRVLRGCQIQRTGNRGHEA